MGDVVTVTCQEFDQSGLYTSVRVKAVRIFVPYYNFPGLMPDGELKSSQVISATAVENYCQDEQCLIMFWSLSSTQTHGLTCNQADVLWALEGDGHYTVFPESGIARVCLCTVTVWIDFSP